MNLSFTADQIARVTGTEGQFPADKIKRVFIDSRRTGYGADSLFVALKGPNHNGHKFIPELIDRGVKYFLVSEELPPRSDAHYIRVSHTLEALQELAAHHRESFDIPVIGITGSNGKTMVKEWVSKLISRHFPVAKSPKSYNSQAGVPLSLFEIDDGHRAAVIEAGISLPGEMEKLYRIIRPDIGIFTTIGAAHGENFKSRQHKIEEKCKLFESCSTVIYNKAESEVESHLYAAYGQSRTTSCSFDDPEADFYISERLKSSGRTRITLHHRGSEYRFTVPFTEDIFIMNALQSIAAAASVCDNLDSIVEDAASLPPIEMRLEMKAGLGNSTLINDAYSNDLHSLEIALNFLKRQSGDAPKTVILSDLLQSGLSSEELFKRINAMLGHANVNRFIGVGDEMSRFKPRPDVHSVSFYTTTEDLLDNLGEIDLGGHYVLLKGARTFAFERIDRALQAQTHHTLLHIDMEALTHNLTQFRRRLRHQTKLMVMVKAAAYGSGIVETAGLLQYHRVDYLGVAYPDEGIKLREAGITLPIMVMSPEQTRFDALIRHRLEPEIYSFKSLKAFTVALKRHQTGIRPYPVHIKIDTGMHRLGFDERDADQLIDMVKSLPEIKPVSVFSHLASGDDESDDDFTRGQIERFSKIAARFESETGYRCIKHIANTSAITRFPDSRFDMVRLGLGLYGISGDPAVKSELKPAGRLVSRIVQIKDVKAGESVGYGRREICRRDTRIATVSIGYADGLDRRLSNRKGSLFIDGNPAEITGNVCMDMCMIDITDLPDVKEGDEVEVFGEHQSVEDLAALLNTIPYEVLTGVSERVKRVYSE